MPKSTTPCPTRVASTTAEQQGAGAGKGKPQQGNATPYEYLDGENDSERWRRATQPGSRQQSLPTRQAHRLLRKNFGREEAEGFRERNLNDTRYICKFFKNYVERYLKLADVANLNVASCFLASSPHFCAPAGTDEIRSDSDRIMRWMLLSSPRAAIAWSNGCPTIPDAKSWRPCMTASSISGNRRDRGPCHVPTTEGTLPRPWPGFRHELEGATVH